MGVHRSAVGKPCFWTRIQINIKYHMGACDQKKQTPLGDLPVPPEPLGPGVPSFEFRCAASPHLK